jgi:hypothetical protein
VGNFPDSNDAVWVLLTIAEAYNYKGNAAKQKEYEDKAAELAKKNNDDFALGAYEDQKTKIQKDIFQNLN